MGVLNEAVGGVIKCCPIECHGSVFEALYSAGQRHVKVQCRVNRETGTWQGQDRTAS